ncbi:MAG: hypothetical protein HXX19_16845, partial [Rhodoferax sp.]|nr:hypothetical protein [Rhodoferax sp.]
MNRFTRIALACAIACNLSTSALAQSASVTTMQAKAPGQRMQGGEIEIRAKVVELDKAARVVTLRGPKGRLLTVDVPDTVQNFDQVQVGDDLVIHYVAAVAAQLEPASKSGIRERVETTLSARNANGDVPGAAQVRTVEILATILALDHKAGTVKLRGVKRSVVLEVPQNVDIHKLKVGEDVRAGFVEAAVV